MNNKLFIFSASFGLALIWAGAVMACGCGGGCAGCSGKSAAQPLVDQCPAQAPSVAQAGQRSGKQAVNVGNTICPVMGQKIDEKFKVTYEYEGRIYNFCCPGCINVFKSDPQKYIAQVEQELAEKAHKAL